MESIIKDIRFAARSLLKRPGFTVIVVLTLTVGIGANAAVFSVINAVLLRPLPYHDAGRVVTLWQNNVKAGIPRNDVSPANFIDWSEQSSSFEAIAGVEPFGFSLFGEGEPERFPAWLVTSGFFQVAGTDALIGRTFTAEDYKPGNERVVNEEPLGKRLIVMFGETETREIVGVIGDVLHNGLHAEPRPEMFVPHQQSASAYMTFLVKTRTDPAAQLAAVKRAIREVNPNQTFAKTATMEELVADSLKQRRFNLFLLGLFAAIALLLATIGIYGSISYSTRQRTNEIGVRIALGAQSRDVLRLVVGQGIGLAVAGVAIGLGAALLLTRVIKGLLFGVSPTDPLTFLAISLLLLFTALIASLIPARRATKVDPLVALRSE